MNHPHLAVVRLLSLASFLAVVRLLSLPLPALATTDADLQKAVKAIRQDKKNQPRYCQYNHDLILGDLACWGKTNTLTDAQRVTLARYTLEHANAAPDYLPTFAAAWTELNACTNVAHRAREMRALFDALLHTYSYNVTRGIPLAERILADNEPALVAALGAETVVGMHENLCRRALGVLYDAEKANFPKHFAAVKAVQPTDKPDSWASRNLMAKRRGAMIRMLNSLAAVDLARAKSLFQQNLAEFTQGEIDSFRLALADVAIAQVDRPAFDAVLAEFKAYPADRRGPYRDIIKKLKKFDSETADRLIAEELAGGSGRQPRSSHLPPQPTDPQLAGGSGSPEEKFADLAVIQGFNDPNTFEYGFPDPGRYERWRTALLARKAIADANPTNRACIFFGNAGAIAWEVEHMIGFDDFKTVKPILAEARRRWPAERRLILAEAMIRACEGDAAGAAASLESSLALKGTKRDDSNAVHRVNAFLRGEGLAGFDRVNAPLNLTSLQRLQALRDTSRRLFEYRRYADAQAIYHEIVTNMYRPDPRKRTKAEYVTNAPQSAGAFAASKWYADWSGYETRFRPYGDAYGSTAATDDSRHLKDVPEPTCDPKWRTGVKVLCDDAGAHVFIRCDDPAIAEVVDGVRDAGELELFFAPGGLDVPYHSVFFCGLPKCDDPHDTDWSAAGHHYRRTKDCLFKDAALTPDGVVAHLSIPWIGFHDGLPLDGTLWNFGVVRGCKGGMQTVGGIVHELSRGLQVEFTFTPAQKLALKRRVCVMAYNRYRKIRQDEGGFILRWNDPVLGDPAFYQAEVAPLLEKLDKAGEALLKPCSDAEVAAFYVDFVPQWAEIRYVLSDLRTHYLTTRLLAL